MVYDFAVLFLFVAPIAYLITWVCFRLLGPHFSGFLGFFSAIWMALDNYTIVCDMRDMAREIPLSRRTMRWVLLSSKARAFHYYTKIEITRRRRYRQRASFHESFNLDLNSPGYSPLNLPVLSSSPPRLKSHDSL